MVTDRPRTLSTRAEQMRRSALLTEPHMAPLAALVNEMRVQRGVTRDIPNFDPLDGGVDATALFVLEAPGRKAVESGFVSRNNDDQSAANFFLACERARLPRKAVVAWNIVPWCLTKADGTVRNPTTIEVEEGKAYLARVLALLPRLEVITLVGNSAQRAHSWILRTRPGVPILHAPHPSPLSVNRSPENRERLEAAFRAVADLINRTDDSAVPESDGG